MSLLLTLEKALSLDVFKNAVVLSGRQGLKNEITSITVMEVPDISDWVSEGELILTTGYPFKDSPVKFAALISRLSEKRLSGIAIKTKRFIDELPAEVLQKADELGFPLIQLSADARFASIISDVAAHVANKEYSLFKRSMEIQHDISNLIIAGGQFQEIALSLSNACNCKVEIFDVSDTLLAEASEHTWAPESSGIAIDIYEKELRLSNEVAGSIKLTSHTKMFDKDEILIIDNTAKSLAVSMIKHRSLKEKEQAQKIEFLNGVASGKISDKNILRERAKKLGINMHIPYVAYVVSGDTQQKSDKPTEVLINDFLDSLSVPCLCWAASKDKINVLAHMQPDADDRKAYAINIGRSIYRHISNKATGSEIKIGIGTYYEDNINLHKSFSEALQAIQIEPMFAGKAGIYHYDEIGIYQILLPLAGTEAASRYIDSFLGKLIQHDKKKKAQLVLTLEQFIKCDSLEEAASNLFVHPKTLALRKARIENILGISLKSEEVKLTLLAAIMLHKINEWGAAK